MVEMNRCIYCTKPLIPREAKDDRLNPSLEHIIPYSLGGSDGFATRDACVGCNGTLGDTVDADCINQPYIVIHRQTHAIKGYSGSVPPLELPARSTAGNEPATMILPHQTPATFKHKPVVIRQDETSSERILVAGDEAQVTGIVSGIVAKAKKRGERVLDVATGLPLDIAASIAAAERETFGKYKVEMVISLDALHRELIKIAFGFAHLVLGWQWTGSPYARRMRLVARGAGTSTDIERLARQANPQIRSKLPMGCAGPTDHFVSLLPLGSETGIVVSLFNDPLLTAFVDVDVDPQLLEAGIAANDRLMAVVNHQSRKTQWIGLLEFTNHLTAVRRSGS